MLLLRGRPPPLAAASQGASLPVVEQQNELSFRSGERRYVLGGRGNVKLLRVDPGRVSATKE